MPYLVVHHTVEDFARWKPYFDSDTATRKAAGSQGGQLLRSTDNPNEIVVIFKWDSTENAHQIAQSQRLRDIMQEAGVIGRPDMFFLEEVEQLSA